MPRYWVIPPFENKNPELFDKVWQFDLTNKTISIGWAELGDVSTMDHKGLEKAVADAYPGSPPPTKSLFVNMLWRFYHEIAVGDVIVARRGRKALAGVGRVTDTAKYGPGRNPTITHSNFLAVEWMPEPRDKAFPVTVFAMHALWEISEALYSNLAEGSVPQTVVSDPAETTDQMAFVLEKYLEDFIVSNFDAIFKGKIRIYEESDGSVGQQYSTDVGYIDILAVETDLSAFVVIELKKGRPSDQVVGQILRYMGWVKKNLCKDSQGVKGLVICHEPDPKLSYALDMTHDIEVKYYDMKFWLKETP